MLADRRSRRVDAPIALAPLDEFRSEVLKKCRFLVDRGFRRAEEYEATSPMGTCVAFVGKHVGFSFYTDLRDRHVGVQVFRVVDGRRPARAEGGYASDVWKLLVREVRPRSADLAGRARAPDISAPAALKDWVVLLKTVGARLLADEPGSVPA